MIQNKLASPVLLVGGTMEFTKPACPRSQSRHAWRVAQFMRAAEQSLPGAPTSKVSREVRIRRARLLLEETLEAIEAMGVRLMLEGSLDDDSPLLFDEIEFTCPGDVDLPGLAKELADVSVVNVGTMLAFGIADSAILTAVDLNNLDKFGPGGYKHPQTGKWIKPPNHPVPDIAAVLRSQGWDPDAEGPTHEPAQADILPEVLLPSGPNDQSGSVRDVPR